MSVCDVPMYPNISIGGTQPMIGVPKGVPRVNRTCNETRDRLRIRLHQRKESLRASNKKVTLNQNILANQNGNVVRIQNEMKPIDPNQVLRVNGNKETITENKSLTTVIKKAGLDAIDPKQTTNNIPIKRLVTEVTNKINKLPTIPTKEKEKENSPVEVAYAARKGIIEDIDKLIKFIEGKDIEIAQKKAAKKARQKQKKEDERRKKIEEEERLRKEEEERIRRERRLEEERLKAELLAKKAALKKAKNVAIAAQVSTKSKKKNKNKKNIVEGGHELFEETIPAMVTIKRIIENNNSPPTVTITLKGSTPDQDKLLYTLVNGHNNPLVHNQSNKVDSSKEESKSKKKKKGGGLNVANGHTEKTGTTTKELKVTLTVDESFRKDINLARSETQKKKKLTRSVTPPPAEQKRIPEETIIDIPSLKLPPGITITKVNGPLASKKAASNVQSEYQSVPVNKSGVIVVDTEKLIQQSAGSKKSKKKKKNKPAQNQVENVKKETTNTTDETSMVTLKNPIFHKLQNKFVKPDETPNMIDINEQATISKGANGMVTIRRPRPMALQNEAPISEYFRPVIHSKSPEPAKEEIKKPPPTDDFEANRLSAQNILWGLPGIQITRVNKNSPVETEPVEQTADVSIIRTSGFNLDKDDWPYESVFTPKDILEDDLDADERELEAFKRFCQQSVPPKHKEKVAHLNVKDIVLMKKNDLTY